MSVKKRKYESGATVWSYVFDAPGSTRQDRKQVKGSGFQSKKEATDAEAQRRIDVQREFDIDKARGGVTAPMPKTLDGLLDEFFETYVEKKLEGKTGERYYELAAYLSGELRAIPIVDITPLHLSREWDRLLESGGHHRRTKEARPLSTKTVSNIASVVSSAFIRAVKWGLVTVNPIPASDPPTPKKRKGTSLTPQQQQLLFAAASGCWCLASFLELSAAMGGRRGEVLALRWSDCVDGIAFVSRSLSQTKKTGLKFKGTKGGDSRSVTLPESAKLVLESHRKQQDVFRKQFGADYRNDLDLIFTEPDGTPLKPDSISASVSALFKRLKLPKPKGASLNMFRHSHGSHLLASGMELTAVSERLGHSSPYVTATVYSHVVKGRDEEAARKWEEFQRKELAKTSVSHGNQIV